MSKVLAQDCLSNTKGIYDILQYSFIRCNMASDLSLNCYLRTV